MTKYALIYHVLVISCTSSIDPCISFYRELKAQHEREMDFLHKTHSDQVCV